ncbi:hypothetical protein [uncultured Clostridium sp.]|jgi:cephalosporin hydroxylase|uniref:hypothetical protein n=1 Tax=uncultured Clostridium sp. TaxID=59620 RepID=UPI002608BA67|nr:hypothetical protein [uncultured Clostridium sp.]
MSVYIINYYLVEAMHSCGCGSDHHEQHDHEERDNTSVIGEIKELGPWAELMPDCYIVKSEKSAEEIAAKVKSVMEDKDRIFVTEINKENAASFTPGAMEWIRQ